MKKVSKNVVVKPRLQELKVSLVDPTLKLKRRSKEKLQSRNRFIFEQEEVSNPQRISIITKERTETKTKVYHEGKTLKNAKWTNHRRHLKKRGKKLN